MNPTTADPLEADQRAADALRARIVKRYRRNPSGESWQADLPEWRAMQAHVEAARIHARVAALNAYDLLPALEADMRDRVTRWAPWHDLRGPAPSPATMRWHYTTGSGVLAAPFPQDDDEPRPLPPAPDRPAPSPRGMELPTLELNPGDPVAL